MTRITLAEARQVRPLDVEYGPMTDEEITAAAISDPENPPLTPEDVASLRRVPRAKSLRLSLDLTQEEFSARYRIPLGTLRDWEQGRTEPDAPARAYLDAIAGDAEAVFRALNHRPAAE